MNYASAVATSFPSSPLQARSRLPLALAASACVLGATAVLAAIAGAWLQSGPGEDGPAVTTRQITSEPFSVPGLASSSTRR